MAYIFRITEDYEEEHEFFDKLDSWLQDELGFHVRDTDGAHYGYQVLEGHYQAKWKKLSNLYSTKYQAMLEAHYCFDMPLKNVVELDVVDAEEWSVFRVMFCYEDVQDGEISPTNGYFFYSVEVKDDDANLTMLKFKLMEHDL